MPDPLRTTTGQNQRTLKPEGPLNPPGARAVRPPGNLVADTICCTAEIGLAITVAADAGPLTIIEATPVAVIGVCPDGGQPGIFHS